MNETVLQILMRRDGLSEEDAQDVIEECKQIVRDGDDPEEVLEDMLGLEPDYIFEIMDY